LDSTGAQYKDRSPRRCVTWNARLIWRPGMRRSSKNVSTQHALRHGIKPGQAAARPTITLADSDCLLRQPLLRPCVSDDAPQLRPGRKYAYTEPHQDSATKEFLEYLALTPEGFVL